MGDLIVFCYFLKQKIMFKSHQIKSNHRVLLKNKVNTYKAQVCAPNHSTTALAAKMGANTNQESMYIIFLFLTPATYSQQLAQPDKLLLKIQDTKGTHYISKSCNIFTTLHFSRNIQIGQKSCCVCSWQAFPAQSNVCE